VHNSDILHLCLLPSRFSTIFNWTQTHKQSLQREFCAKKRMSQLYLNMKLEKLPDTSLHAECAIHRPWNFNILRAHQSSVSSDSAHPIGGKCVENLQHLPVLVYIGAPTATNTRATVSMSLKPICQSLSLRFCIQSDAVLTGTCRGRQCRSTSYFDLPGTR